jgi:hypothetical protein
MPPTFRTVEELSEFASIEELYASIPSRRIYARLPELFYFNGGYGLKLPNDPEYSIAEYKQPHYADEPCRIIMQKNGLLKTEYLDGEE